jgi:lysophospholipase L1-like esterase
VRFKPSRVVLAFTGNVDGCDQADYQATGITGVVANYDRSLREMARNFSGIPVTVVASPAMNNLIVPAWYPENGNPAINTMYQADSVQLGLRYSTVADDTLTPGHVYTADRPAYGTKAPLVQVRASDGVHLTSEGTIYYALALLN